MRVVLTLRQGDEPKVIENLLYKHTALEDLFWHHNAGRGEQQTGGIES